MHRALFEAGRATGAAVVDELVAVVALSHLGDRVLRAGAVAAVAFEAVAARQAPAGLVLGGLFRQPADHLVEPGDAAFGREVGLSAARGVTEVPQVQLVEAGRRMFGSPHPCVPASQASMW